MYNQRLALAVLKTTGIFSAASIIAGCTAHTKVDVAKQAQEKEAVAALNVEKKAYEENRFLNADEVKTVTQSYEKIAETSTPEQAKKIRAMAEAITNYRAKTEEFRNLGGAKVESLKLQEDLDKRLAMVDELGRMSDRVKETCIALREGPSTIRTLELEHQMVGKLREQLDFYKAHYGQWQIQKDGTVRFTIAPDELAKFNRLATDIRLLGSQQVVIMKQNTAERLHSLNKTQ